jgi:UDP-N-acetylglucosamine 2-epimerase
VQEEAIVLGRPCITLRHTSERWETLLLKANVLFPLFRQDPMSDVVEEMIDKKITSHPYGEHVADRIYSMVDQIAS